MKETGKTQKNPLERKRQSDFLESSMHIFGDYSVFGVCVYYTHILFHTVRFQPAFSVKGLIPINTPPP